LIEVKTIELFRLRSSANSWTAVRSYIQLLQNR